MIWKKIYNFHSIVEMQTDMLLFCDRYKSTCRKNAVNSIDKTSEKRMRTYYMFRNYRKCGFKLQKV